MRQEEKTFPLVSIVIPVYNGANYLKEAIDSALSQTYPNCEIIVVNDGSDDSGETEKAALCYGNKIRYFRKENGGVATALNRGIREMRGEYFAWLSHDDIFYPNKIDKQMKIMQSTGIKITTGFFNYFTDNGKVTPFRMTEFYDKKLLETNAFSVLYGMTHFGGFLLHKSIFDFYGVFREDLQTTQDDEFLFRILRKEKCIFIDDIVNGVRCHPLQSGKTSVYMERDRDEIYKIFLTDLTDEEKVQNCGSVYNFYYQMLVKLLSQPITKKSFPICLKGLKQHGNAGRKLENSEKEIYIYGAGKYGRRLLFDLRCRGAHVRGFLDKSEALNGKTVDGVTCFSLDIVSTFSDQQEIIIASALRADMAAALDELGVRQYRFKEDYERENDIFQTPPPIDSVCQWIDKYLENGWKKDE